MYGNVSCYEADGKFATPDCDDIYSWIVKSFDAITDISICKTFWHIGFIPSDTVDYEIAVSEIDDVESDELVDVDPSEPEDNVTADILENLEGVLI